MGRIRSCTEFYYSSAVAVVRYVFSCSRRLLCVFWSRFGGWGGCVKVEQGGAMLWRGRMATLCSKLVAPLDGCVVGVNNRTSRPLLQPTIADTLPTYLPALPVCLLLGMYKPNRTTVTQNIKYDHKHNVSNIWGVGGRGANRSWILGAQGPLFCIPQHAGFSFFLPLHHPDICCEYQLSGQNC